MSDGIEFYKQQALESTSSIAWLAKLQKQALADFTEIGFPKRKNDDWKYTSVDSFLKQEFTNKKPVEFIDKHDMEVVATIRQTDAPVGIKIPIVNGVAIGLAAIAETLPPGVIVQPLFDAINENPKKVEPYLNQILTEEHGFQTLNTAMLESGLFIYIPKNVCLPEPLLLTHIQTSSNQATFLRHLIVADEGSHASIIEDYQGDSDTCYFTNTITEVFTDNGATVKHYKVQRESKSSYHFGHVAAKQMAKSSFSSHLLTLGGQWSRSDTSVNLEGKDAECVLNGIYVPTSNQHMDQQISVNHLVAGCRSNQDYKGIIDDKAKAIFNGKIFVEKSAVMTEALQQNKNLLLSNQAEIYTKPQLDIYADDVVCTHGATVGQLDEDALFYLSTRGIDNAQARRYLLQAFAADNLQAIDNKLLSSWMTGLLNQQMG
jgi:Fe-S cluster assembly protein SufD